MSHRSEGAKNCLSYETRSSTPPEIRKFRRSTNLEPGKRFQHHGVVDDYKNMNLDDKIYGDTDRSYKIGASDLINHKKMSELEKINVLKSEKTYKRTIREPLGRSPDKRDTLPNKFTVDNQAFGKSTLKSAENVRALLNTYDAKDDDNAGADLYKRSHGSYAPGEQIKRNYNWNIDPDQTRFGCKGDTIAFNGVSSNITAVLNDDNAGKVVNRKNVEELRMMGDILGQTKDLGQGSTLRPANMIYGKPPVTKRYGAADVMRGKYTDMDQLPDKDLGRSITPGFRNVSREGRAFGCPSIRNDIPALPPGKRSLADSQNYGDDVPAQDLVNPKPFSDLHFEPGAFEKGLPKSKLVSLFSNIGIRLSDGEIDGIFNRAANGGNTASINSYRDCLNDYLIRNDLVK